MQKPKINKNKKINGEGCHNLVTLLLSDYNQTFFS